MSMIDITQVPTHQEQKEEYVFLILFIATAGVLLALLFCVFHCVHKWVWKRKPLLLSSPLLVTPPLLSFMLFMYLTHGKEVFSGQRWDARGRNNRQKSALFSPVGRWTSRDSLKQKLGSINIAIHTDHN